MVNCCVVSCKSDSKKETRIINGLGFHSMEELDSSALGTLEYWEETYKRELREFEARGDPGEIWFGEDSAHRVATWLSNHNVSKDASVIDIGCGNGYSLVELANEGFTTLKGIDYSPDAVALAHKFALKEGYSNIDYKVFDIIKEDVAALGKFAVVHDKGTYDAVSLSDEAKTNRESYIDSVVRLLDDNGIFVITSCNWTEKELVEQLSGRLELSCVVPTPQFKFGGCVGNVVTTAVFNNHKHNEHYNAYHFAH